MRFRLHHVAAASVAMLATGAFAWLWPLDGTQPLAAWVPGEAGLRGSLARVTEADPTASLVDTHAPNILVLRSVRFPRPPAGGGGGPVHDPRLRHDLPLTSPNRETAVPNSGIRNSR